MVQLLTLLGLVSASFVGGYYVKEKFTHTISPSAALAVNEVKEKQRVWSGKEVLFQDKIKGALFGAALGDALGRVTEFIDTTEEIQRKYGQKGVTSFNDFKKNDWITHPLTHERIAAYTDDTVMSIIVFEESLKALHAQELTDVLNARFKGLCKENTRNAKVFMSALTERFKGLFGEHALTIDPLYHIRAHGIQNRKACLDFSRLLELNDIPTYDKKMDLAVAAEGGCGSVMRAWPLGIVFNKNSTRAALYADYQSRITHRNPMARAASAAIAVGIAALLQGDAPEEAVEKMIMAARKFDGAEKLYKPYAYQVLQQQSVREDRLLTSDMIAYAALQAQKGTTPSVVLGTHNRKKGFRSSEGFLLGWAADEAVAAAVYVFLRHPHDLTMALQESVNTPGDSDSIATLAAVLVGAHAGFKEFEQTGFDYSFLENREMLKGLADSVKPAVHFKRNK
ncbi:ADP-ribosylglycohydrolase family protein [Candidatus Dependentiae bacterium]|nr:ADP-ribosylglycohydrolase family protein [Candidatus Dependentiae bacterium]